MRRPNGGKIRATKNPLKRVNTLSRARCGESATIEEKNPPRKEYFVSEFVLGGDCAEPDYGIRNPRTKALIS